MSCHPPRYQILSPLSDERPLVSVIMFCRNRVYSLRRAVESILHQSYSNWELVIQDGASTDGSKEAIASYEDARIKMISEPDAGPFDAMWRAIKRAQGEVIGFCLSDEELLPKALEEGVNYFLRFPETAALGRDLYYTDIDASVRHRVDSSEFNFHDYLGQQSKMSLVTVLFRRAALLEVGLLNRQWRTDCADFELIARIGERFRFDYYPGPSALFAQGHPGQLSTTPEVGYFCTKGHLRFIDEFYRESPGRELLRDLALGNAFAPVKRLYQEKGSKELEARLNNYFAEFGVKETIPSFEVARQAISIGALDLALDFLQRLRPPVERHNEWLSLLLEIFGQFWQQAEAIEKWEWLINHKFPGAYEQWLKAQLRVGQPSLEKVLANQKMWSSQLVKEKAERPAPKIRRPRAFKIAFHSSDWSGVEARLQILPMLPLLKKRGFEIICYGNEGVRNPSDSTAQEFLRKVEKDEIEIFIELSGLDQGHQWEAISLRAAPVQIAYLGMMATTGIDQVDYQISDSFLSPMEASPYHSETVLRLPGTYTCFSFDSSAKKASPVPRRFDHRPTFGCFASSSLLNQPLLESWLKLLQLVPESRLMIANPELNSSDCRSFFRHFFSSQGIAGERLSLSGRSNQEISPYLTAQIDLYLDTFPHNDPFGVAYSLSSGVPAITQAGRIMASRLGGSLMRSVGLEECITPDFNEYILTATKLIHELEQLREWRRNLPDQVFTKGLTDVTSFTEKFETLLHSIR